MSKIVYLGHFDNQEKRVTSPAGITMMKYIINAMTRSMGGCTVISPAQSKGEKLDREVTALNDNVQLVYLKSYGKIPKWNIPLRIIKRIANEKILNSELDKMLDDNDTLVVYHSLSLMNSVKRIIKKKNIRFVLQVCEIYSDVIGDKNKRKKEIDFIKKADAYIFSSNLLEKQFNTENKEFAICLGTYTTDVKEVNQQRTDDKIHVVYAGTLDPRKGAVTGAASAAEYLPCNYHVHILGFGSDEEVNSIKNYVAQLSKKCECKVTYDGCLAGEEYINFIQKCDIGLSTQNPEADFNATSFPSKILSYMTNGLRVVSVLIPAIETSDVGKYMYYYTIQNPQEIAKAIMSVNLNDDYNGRAVVAQLDKQFCDDLQKILET